MARRRTSSGRFAKGRKRATTRRRSYRVRARRNPSRRYGPSTRQGQIRRTSRRAYYPKRRRARRNQRGILGSPAVRYSLAAAAGFAAASYADTADILNPVKADGTPALPFGIKGSVLAAVITFALGEFALKGQNKQYARAAGVGMLAPSAISMVQNAMQPGARGGASYYVPARGKVHLLSASSQPAQSFSRASQALDNCA